MGIELTFQCGMCISWRVINVINYTVSLICWFFCSYKCNKTLINDLGQRNLYIWPCLQLNEHNIGFNNRSWYRYLARLRIFRRYILTMSAMPKQEETVNLPHNIKGNVYMYNVTNLMFFFLLDKQNNTRFFHSNRLISAFRIKPSSRYHASLGDG